MIRAPTRDDRHECNPVHTPPSRASPRYGPSTQRGAGHHEAEVTRDIYGVGEGSQESEIFCTRLETSLNTDTSHAICHFISPPTRKQLMAGSANVHRVYKTEA